MATEAASDRLEQAEAAFRRADWVAAKALFEAVRDEEKDARALDGLGQTLWFLGDLESALALREQAYAEFKSAGERCHAGRIALWLSVEHGSIGNDAVANGWFRRAERLLADAPLCVEQVELEVARGRRATRPDEAERHFERALAIAREFGDPDAEIRALTQLGILLVSLGRIDDGMGLLDECMAAAMGGEMHDPWQIGGACCSMLIACERVSDLRRAAEWCRMVVEFTRKRNYTPLYAWCRALYGGVLTAIGEWRQAEQELLAALRMYEQTHRANRLFALARLAELRLRQGRLEEAETLIAGYEDRLLAIPTVVSLHLLRGETALAIGKVERRLEPLGEENPLAAALLSLLVRARLRHGDLARAASGAERLIGIAGERENLRALAVMALGEVAAAGGEPAAAGHLERAIELFVALGLPLEEGEARLLLARVLYASEPGLALEEARAALALFERLGAARHADEAAAFLRAIGAPGRSAPKRPGELTRREREVLALLGRGLSNPEIATRLYISPKTAEHHVGRILAKLGLRSRAEAAAYAVREAGEKMRA